MRPDSHRLSTTRLAAAILAVTLLILARPSRPALAQAGSPFQERNAAVDYTFGEQAVFAVEILAPTPPDTVKVFIQPAGTPNTPVFDAKVIEKEEGLSQVTFTWDLNQNPLRAFSRVDYWFQLTFPTGPVTETPHYSFFYEDNRFTWEVLSASPFRTHWYAGDTIFAQHVLDVAERGLGRIQTLLPLQAPSQVDIYVYASSAELQATLQSGGENWIAGHADPDLGVMVVALPSGPEQNLLMEQRIPHELMHILLYNAVQKGYLNLPTWLNEGLASSAELYPNPDYQVLLQNAEAKGTLLSIDSLCQPFPRDASSTLLAYAEAASFTRYLHSTYGSTGLQSLVTYYANGLDCKRGAEAALEVSLPQLERQWRREALAENTTLTAVNNLLPWLLILLLVALGPVIALAREFQIRKGLGSG